MISICRFFRFGVLLSNWLCWSVGPAGTTYTNLEGPAFGIRVGIYHVNNFEEPLPLAALTDKWEDDSSEDNSPYRGVLYKLSIEDSTTHEVLYKLSIEDSTTHDHPSDKRFAMVSTLPGHTKQELSRRLQLPVVTICLQLPSDLETIPEESDMVSASVIQREGIEGIVVARAS